MGCIVHLELHTLQVVVNRSYAKLTDYVGVSLRVYNHLPASIELPAWVPGSLCGIISRALQSLASSSA